MSEHPPSTVKLPRVRHPIARHYTRLKQGDPKWIAWLVIAVVGILVYLFAGSPDDMIEGKVVGVGDGTSLIMVDSAGIQRRMRLAYIEAPELSQSLGQQSHKWLLNRLLNREVRVENRGPDSQGRTLVRLWVYEVEINLEILRAGMAFHIKREDSGQPSDEFVIYQRAESEAREHKTGVWFEEFPRTPWQYRELATPPALRQDSPPPKASSVSVMP